jgi:hypothetical protein
MANTLNGIDLFATVVEAGSFAQAAERLHLTRSAVGGEQKPAEVKAQIEILRKIIVNARRIEGETRRRLIPMGPMVSRSILQRKYDED